MKYKKMADGGVADDGFDPQKQSLLNQWLAQDVAQRPGGNPAPDAPAPTAPKATDAHLTEESNDADTEKVVDAHPGTQPDELTPYLKGEESKVDKWGPEQEEAVMQHLLKSENSPGMAVAKGAAGLGDAIMQGVSRAGSGNFLSNMENREQNINKTVGELTPRLRQANLEGMKTKEGLESMTSASPLGATEAKAAQFLAKQLWPNLTPAQLTSIGQNPQALAKILPPGIDLKKALAEIASTAAFREATVGLQKQTLENTKVHERTEEGLAAQNQALQHPVAHFLAKHGIIETPKAPAAGGAPEAPSSFATEADAESAHLPPGTIVMIGGRRARVK